MHDKYEKHILRFATYTCRNQLLQRLLTCGLVIVDTDPVQLQVTVSVVSPCGIDAVLIADHFPELQRQNEKYHSYLQKVRIYLLAMWFVGLGTLNEENSSGFAFWIAMKMTGFFPFSPSHILSHLIQYSC